MTGLITYFATSDDRDDLNNDIQNVYNTTQNAGTSAADIKGFSQLGNSISSANTNIALNNNLQNQQNQNETAMSSLGQQFMQMQQNGGPVAGAESKILQNQLSAQNPANMRGIYAGENSNNAQVGAAAQQGADFGFQNASSMSNADFAAKLNQFTQSMQAAHFNAQAALSKQGISNALNNADLSGHEAVNNANVLANNNAGLAAIQGSQQTFNNAMTGAQSVLSAGSSGLSAALQAGNASTAYNNTQTNNATAGATPVTGVSAVDDSSSVGQATNTINPSGDASAWNAGTASIADQPIALG